MKRLVLHTALHYLLHPLKRNTRNTYTDKVVQVLSTVLKFLSSFLRHRSRTGQQRVARDVESTLSLNLAVLGVHVLDKSTSSVISLILEVQDGIACFVASVEDSSGDRVLCTSDGDTIDLAALVEQAIGEEVLLTKSTNLGNLWDGNGRVLDRVLDSA